MDYIKRFEMAGGWGGGEELYFILFLMFNDVVEKKKNV